MSGALKDMYNRQTVAELAAAIAAEYEPFDVDAFMTRVFDEGWEERELKERMRHITLSMQPFLPQDFSEALAILTRVLPRLTEQSFEKMVFPDYVEVFGLNEYDAAIHALEWFTQFVSAEFAIRPFLHRYPGPGMDQMLAWARHEHPGVRRLASEGCRPRLPWAMALPALKADPSPIFPILEHLKGDQSESVRRSVANNLNDISKDNPDVVIDILRRWQQDDSTEMRQLISHGLRTLLKQGRPEALALLGYPPDPEVAIKNLAVSPDDIPLGGAVTLTFEILSQSNEPQNLMIDYVVHLMRANGRQTEKVFKLSKRTIEPGELIVISRKHSFRPVTTRKYYPGAHAIEPQINGKRFGRVEFNIK